VTSALAGGLATVAGAALIALALPSFARYRTGSPPPAPAAAAAGEPAAVTVQQ
jgi:hypothetical protein